jgi:type II secretory pathway component GspD/PulD (secretin)
VVLGGLRRQERIKTVDQIPFIADLPIIGELFKSTSTGVKNSELVVFLSPHIYKGEPVPEEQMTKFREITANPLFSLDGDRDSTKQMLLDKIKKLQNEKDKDVHNELLLTLDSLEKILSAEMQEALESSEQALAGSTTN